MAKRTLKPITAAEGADYRIDYLRNDGYSLYFQGEYAGTFDTLTDALNERNRLAYGILERAA